MYRISLTDSLWSSFQAFVLGSDVKYSRIKKAAILTMLLGLNFMSRLFCNCIQANAVVPTYTTRLLDFNDLLNSDHTIAPIWLMKFMVMSGSNSATNIYKEAVNAGKRISAKNGRSYLHRRDYDVNAGNFGNPELLNKIRNENRAFIGQETMLGPMEKLFKMLKADGEMTEHVHIAKGNFGRGKVAFPLSLNMSHDSRQALTILHLRMAESQLSARLYKKVFYQFAELTSGKEINMAAGETIRIDHSVKSIPYEGFIRLNVTMIIQLLFIFVAFLAEITTFRFNKQLRNSKRKRMWRRPLTKKKPLRVRKIAIMKNEITLRVLIASYRSLQK
ncbi:hypothetical protein HDE_02150 [Halotydeus destructor]|nr:hypothetical protein HDE_02150 [Halotydeus destructor]